MARKQTKQQTNNTLEISKTKDVITNDFNLEASKIPALSTIRQQLKTAKTLVNTNITGFITEFDRLKIAVNLIVHGSRIRFEDLGMIDVEDPQSPPSFMKEKQRKEERARQFIEDDEDDGHDLSDLFDDEDFIDEEEEIERAIAEARENNNIDEQIVNLNNVPDLFKNTKIKRQIRYDEYKETVGLINMCIYKGYFIVDISGKWMSDNGILGSLHKDNIAHALRQILSLGIVNFNIPEFMEVAQVFVCDVCVDIALDSDKQVERYIDGLSSYVPLTSNRYNIKKYGRHGLMLKPKALNAGMSFCIYSKGQELDYSIKRSTRATLYTDTIGDDGVKLAERTLRLEVKLFRLRNIRKILNISPAERGVVRLEDVLNSRTPVMWHIFEKFIGNTQTLLDGIEWMSDVLQGNEEMSLNNIFIAERFVEILKENNFDLSLAKSHIRTEYVDVSESQLTYFNSLINTRRNLFNFLTYRKPKTVTIMLDMLRRLQNHYATSMGVDNG